MATTFKVAYSPAVATVAARTADISRSGGVPFVNVAGSELCGLSR